ncbi:MAG: DUF5320 domain-containing protein [Kosmotogaceae bacterium]
MPGFDRTGPSGQGPMTGRGLGMCSGYARPVGFRGPGLARRNGWYGRGRGFGFGRGRGFGRGYGRGYYPAYPADYPAYEPEPTPREEEKMLEDYVAELEEELSAVKKRLQEIENKEEE